MKQPTVLNTRVRQQAGELSRLLAEAGFTSFEAPAIQIVGAWDPAELERVREGLRANAFEWVVLPSQNAGAALRSELFANQVVCGAATALALGIQAAITLDKFSALAALEALRPRVQPGQRVLVPRAEEGRDELIEGLHGLGAVVQAPIAYRTSGTGMSELSQAAALVRAGEVDAVTACSPSAVSGLLQVMSPAELGACALVCLGETTAAAARAAGVHVDAVASKTTMAALVVAVQAALASREVLS